MPLSPSLTSELPPVVLLWLLGAGLVALTGSLLLVPCVARVARRLGIVDTPGDARRIHRVPTPRAGGVAVFGAFVLANLAFVRLAPSTAYVDVALANALLFGGALLLAVGLADDRFGVRPRVKLAAQVGAAAIAWGVGFRPDLPLATGTAADAVVFTLWVVGVSNAFNLIDGMDGLAGSVATAALLSLGVYAALVGNVAAVLPCVALAAAVGGFLRFNMAPAKIFLGDSGSLFVGYALALLSLAAASRPGHTVGVLLPLCVLAVPLLDTGATIARRWLRRVPVFTPDARHIHHRLAALGYGPRGVAGVVFVVTVAFSAFGTLLSMVPRETALTLGGFGSVLFCWVLLYGSSRLAYHEFGEAVNMLLAAPRRARRVIRAQIAVGDLVHELEYVDSPVALRSLLSARTRELGLVDIALVRGAAAHVTPSLAGHRGEWRLLYPLDMRDETGEAQCLVLTCERGPLADAGTAERVARALAAAIDAWFTLRVRADGPLARPAAREDGRRLRARGRRRPEYARDYVRALDGAEATPLDARLPDADEPEPVGDVPRLARAR